MRLTNFKRQVAIMRQTAQRLLALLVMVTGGSLAVWAQSTSTYIVIWQQSGRTLSYALSSQPEITYAGDTLVLSYNNVTVEYPVADILKITFSDKATDIAQGAASGQHELITVTPDGVSLQGFEAGMPVRLYTSAGQVVTSLSTHADGSLLLSLSSFPTGVYVVKAGKSTLKVLHR